MEGCRALANLDISGGLAAVTLDVFFLLIVLAMIVGGVRIARRLTRWRIERRMGSKRGTGESERTDTLGKLARLRDSGSLSEEEFEAAQERVLRE
jgi:hypothetical protein